MPMLCLTSTQLPNDSLQMTYPVLFNILFIDLLAESIFFGFLIKVFPALPLIFPSYDCYTYLHMQRVYSSCRHAHKKMMMFNMALS